MDFGIGFLSNNIMLPILDFFYGVFSSYGLAIIALTLVIRFAVFPLSAGQIRNMRRMKIVQPLMKERQEKIKQKYASDPKKQQEEMGKIMQDLGANPLAGCLPTLMQMPILFALFATLRGSPFTNTPYTVDVQVFPSEQVERIVPQAFATKPKNIYIEDGVHEKVAALLPAGNKLIVGDKTKVELQTPEGKSLQTLLKENPDSKIEPQLAITKGAERLQINEDGTITALEPGDATIEVTLPGIAADTGFLFIDALGKVGVTDDDGNINFDILAMVLMFGVGIYVNQQLSGAPQAGGNDQQQTINKITPLLFSGMFLFFPLPAGVLMYIVVANFFQMGQTWFLSREPLPDDLQKIVAEQEKAEASREALPFERKRSKKREKTSG